MQLETARAFREICAGSASTVVRQNLEQYLVNTDGRYIDETYADIWETKDKLLEILDDEILQASEDLAGLAAFCLPSRVAMTIHNCNAIGGEDDILNREKKVARLSSRRCLP